MKISVTVKPNAKRPGVVQVGEREYKVAVNAPAHEGKANAAVVELLAEYFDVPKSRITILHGHTGRRKLVEIG